MFNALNPAVSKITGQGSAERSAKGRTCRNKKIKREKNIVEGSRPTGMHKMFRIPVGTKNPNICCKQTFFYNFFDAIDPKWLNELGVTLCVSSASVFNFKPINSGPEWVCNNGVHTAGPVVSNCSVIKTNGRFSCGNECGQRWIALSVYDLSTGAKCLGHFGHI